MLGAGQTSASVDEMAAGLGDAIGRPAPKAVSFAEFVRCFQWCVTRPSTQAHGLCMHAAYCLEAACTRT